MSEKKPVIRMQALLRISLPVSLEEEHGSCPCPNCLEKLEGSLSPSDFFRHLVRSGAEVEEVLPWPMGGPEAEGLGVVPMPINLFLDAFTRVLAALVAEWELKVDSDSGSKQLRALEPTLRALLKVLGTLEGVTSTRKLLEADTPVPLVMQLLRKFPGIKAMGVSSPEQIKEILQSAPTEVLRSLAVSLHLVEEGEAETMDHTTLIDRIVSGPKGAYPHLAN